MRRGDRLTVTATALDDQGRGVAEVAGVRLAVAGLLPGEAGEVELEHLSPHRLDGFAALISRAGPASPDRRPPACPGFGRCGGCSLQALAYPAQLAAKRARVADALAALPAPPVPPVIAAPVELGFRNRGSYVVGERAGDLVLGAYAPGSHALVETLGCRAVEPLIDELARRCRDALAASGLPVYREAGRTGQLRYVVIRTNRAGQALVGLVTAPDAPRDRLAAVAGAVAADARVAGVVWVRNASTSGAVLSDDHEPLVGAASLPEVVAGVTVAVALGTFTQVNLAAAERLYDDLAARAAGDATYAIDLYAGVGAIAFALARRGLAVVAVERNPRAVAAGAAAAAAAGPSCRVRFVVGDAAELTTALADEPAELVVVNPPRKGLDGATLAAVLARRPAALAYVSCEPATLARDLAALGAAGYRIDWLQPYDLMPGAGPVETAALLRLA